MRISDWSSDVCSSDLRSRRHQRPVLRRAADQGDRPQRPQVGHEVSGMNVKDFEYIAQLLYKRSGLVITQEKAYLLESRLNPVAREWDFEGIDALIEPLRSKHAERLPVDVTDAMPTNESFFFRDKRSVA